MNRLYRSGILYKAFAALLMTSLGFGAANAQEAGPYMTISADYATSNTAVLRMLVQMPALSNYAPATHSIVILPLRLKRRLQPSKGISMQAAVVARSRR